MRAIKTTAIVMTILMVFAGSAAAEQPHTMTPLLGGSWFMLPNVFGGMQAAPRTPKTTTVDEVVDAMQGYYENARSYSAEFRQVYEEINGLKKKSSGLVYFKKGGKMRWDYMTPEEKYLFSDGTRFMSWEPAYQQYCMTDLGSTQLPTALRFLSGDGDIREEFTVKMLKAVGDKHRIELTPKVPSSAFETIEFTLSPKSYRVEEVVIIDALGNINTLKFAGAVINDDLPDENFWTDPPADATELCGD